MREGEKFVFTDAFEGDWRPAGKPFMVGYVELSDAAIGKTNMIWARAIGAKKTGKPIWPWGSSKVGTPPPIN